MPPRCVCNSLLFIILDILISSFIVFPCVVLYWSGTWKFLDLHMFPNNLVTSSTLCSLIGIFILICGYYALPTFREHVLLEDLHWDYTRHLFISRIFMYITALGYLFLWRGVWNLTELCFGEDLKNNLTIAVISFASLTLLRSSSNALAPPFVLFTDGNADFYETFPRFRSKITSLIPYSLDILLTTCVIHPLVVTTWVGLWHTFDVMLSNEKQEISYFISIGIGLGGYFIVCALQNPTQYLSKILYEKHKFAELMFGAIFRFIVVLFQLLLWRGTWGYTKDFILTPEFVNDKPWVLWLFHGGGFMGLLVLQVGNTMSFVGCAVDSENAEDGTGVELPLKYLQNYCGRYSNHDSLSVQVISDDERQSLLQSGQSFLQSSQESPVYGGF